MELLQDIEAMFPFCVRAKGCELVFKMPHDWTRKELRLDEDVKRVDEEFISYFNPPDPLHFFPIKTAYKIVHIVFLTQDIAMRYIDAWHKWLEKK